MVVGREEECLALFGDDLCCHARQSFLAQSAISSSFCFFSCRNGRRARSMSGKAPPKGPRALLSSLPAVSPLAAPAINQPPPQQQQPHRPSATSLSQPSAAPKPIPTGPRIFRDSAFAKLPPAGPKNHSTNGYSNVAGPSTPNGLGSHALQSNRHPISIKGKKPDTATSWSNTGVNTFFIHY